MSFADNVVCLADKSDTSLSSFVKFELPILLGVEEASKLLSTKGFLALISFNKFSFTVFKCDNLSIAVLSSGLTPTLSDSLLISLFTATSNDSSNF